MVLKEILITLYHYELQSTTNTQLTTPSENRIVMRFGVQQALKNLLKEIIRADTNRITARFAAILLSTWSLSGLYILSEYHRGGYFYASFSDTRSATFAFVLFSTSA